ncbi:MAG: YciI family protein [Pelagimonas sp.]|jgi:uncharacterized protein YciI|nr:YciI family protein [Pelagimonas sp.]
MPLRDNPLFVIDLHYTVPFEQVEPHLEAHMAFIQAAREDGFIVVAGAKVPRTGGVIIASAPSLESAQARMTQDPFCTANVVSLGFTQFKPGTLCDALKDA